MDELERLQQKLNQCQERHVEVKQEERGNASFIAIEIVAGITVGATLGYYTDQFLHTKILFLLIFMILGLISSMYNIYKKHK